MQNLDAKGLEQHQAYMMAQECTMMNGDKTSSKV